MQAVEKPEVTRRRDLDAQALFSLSLATLPTGRRRAEQLQFAMLEPGEALRVLADGRQEVGCALRPAVMRRLVGLAQDDSDAVGGLADDIDRLNRALAVEAGLPDAELASSVTRLRDHLLELSVRLQARVIGPTLPPVRPPHFDRAPTAPPPPGVPRSGTKPAPPPAPPADDAVPTDEEAFYQSVADIFAVPVETVGAPGCEDDHRDTHLGTSCYVTKSGWWTSMTIDDMRGWTSPRNWPKCSHRTFFRKMEEVQGSYQAGPDPNEGKSGKKKAAKFGTPSWAITYDETVKLADEITTRLAFEHFEETDDGGDGPPTMIWTTYELADPDHPGEMVVDAGRMDVQLRETPNGPLCWVLLTKWFEFSTEAYRDWPTLACDTFFGEKAMMMASNCQNHKA